MRNYKLIDWGKSMYGGYYASVADVTGGLGWRGVLHLHADTYKELRDKLAGLGLKAERTKRFDN